MKFNRLALVGLVLGALVIAPQATDLAGASALAIAGNSQTQGINTASYLAAAVLTTGASNPGQALVISNANGGTAQFFYVKSFGTDSLIAFTISATSSNGGAPLKKCPVGTTFTSATKCSDNSTPTSAAAGAVTAALPTGAWLPMSVTPNKNGVTLTISITVTNTQDRAPITSIS